MAPGPLFIWSNGHFLMRAHFVLEVKKALELASMEASDFNGHSLRIGAASKADTCSGKFLWGGGGFLGFHGTPLGWT